MAEDTSTGFSQGLHIPKKATREPHAITDDDTPEPPSNNPARWLVMVFSPKANGINIPCLTGDYRPSADDSKLPSQLYFFLLIESMIIRQAIVPPPTSTTKTPAPIINPL